MEMICAGFTALAQTVLLVFLWPLCLRCRLFLISNLNLFAVISLREVLFEPYIQADKEVAAAHFLDFQLGLARAPVAPGDRNSGPGIASYYRLKRKFDRDVEVGEINGRQPSMTSRR